MTFISHATGYSTRKNEKNDKSTTTDNRQAFLLCNDSFDVHRSCL